jgi:hypothetical protein
MQIKVRLDFRPIQRWARLFSKQTLLRAARVMGPTLVALTFGGVAHAQGTMDFSGAQTLMGTFKTFAIYAGAIICFGGLIFAGIRMMSGRFQTRSQDSSVRCSVPEYSAGVPIGSAP